MSTATAVKIPASEHEALTVAELRAWRGLLHAHGCLAKRLDAELAIIDKRRDYERPGEVEVLHVIGDVEDRTALIVDDMVDTAGTLVKAAEALKHNGAKSVLASATHAVLSGPAVQRIEESPIKRLVVTNTIPMRSACRSPKIECLSVAKLLAEAILSVHDETSVSKLFI